MFNRLLARFRRDARPLHDACSVRTRLYAEMPAAAYTADDRRREFRSVFRSTPGGRRVLAQVLDRCRVCERSFVPGDSLETARREGMRDTGLWLLEILADDAADRPGTAQAEPAPSDAPDDRD